MNWYANMRIRNKLLSGYAIVVVLSCIVGYSAISGMKALKELQDDTHHIVIRSIVLSTDVAHLAQQHKREFLRYLLSPDDSSRHEISTTLKQLEGQMQNTLDMLDGIPIEFKERQLLSSLQLAWGAYVEAVDRLLVLADEGTSADMVQLEWEQVSPRFKALEDLTGQIRALNVEESEAHDLDAGKIYRRLTLWLLGLSIMAVIASFVIALFITRSVAGPMGRGLEAVQALARGGEEKARLTEAIASGDLSQNITLAEPFKIPAESLTTDETGKLLQSVASLSKTQSLLDHAFARMTESLRRSRVEEQASDWLKTGLNELNALLRGEQKTEEMADKVLTFMAEYLKAGTGAFYVYDETGKALVLAATYAFTRRKNLSDRFRLGEGIIGQAAVEKKMICLSNVPPDYLQIGSALGAAAPKNVVALPLLHNGQLVAAMELGTFQPFSDRELDFLNQSMEGIAIGFGVSYSRQRINELLEQTQQQTEELRVQQEELQQTNEELEERAEMLEQQGKQIQAKNMEIETASAELRRRAEEIEKVSTYKSQFLANMSHELRSPLNSMMLLSNLLVENKEGTLTNKQQNFAETINSAGKDLLNLINDILDLSKVEAGQLDLVYENVEIDSLCENLDGLFRSQAEQKGLGFSITVEDGAPKTIRADEQRTQQILKNLLANAIKFTEKGSVSVNLSVPAGAANPLAVPAIAFSVRDTGLGIEKDKFELVFQAFQQADGSTSRKYGGTGLGLSISLQLARRVGGDIRLESEPGKGSVFTLYLPIAGEVADGSAPETAALSRSSPPAFREPFEVSNGIPRPLPDDRERLKKSDKSILIIEDDLNFAKTLMDLVGEKGFGCIVAADGTSGVHLADLYRPSAIILDVMLPGMDGWSVMRSLKDNPATRHIPVHFITCVDERQKGLSMGAVSFHTKPISLDQLNEAVGNIEQSVEKTLRRLLIIEDNKREAEGLNSLLQARNLEISMAATGAQAMELLDREPMDCIVLDIGLPDMSGFDLLEHIRGAEKLRSIPVIIHTGRDLSHEEELKLQHYAKSIIIKGAKGPERLLNEVALFLHMVENELPREKQKMIRAAFDKEAMLDGKKVLLVDDDMRNVFSLSSILTDKNMTVIEAENGREALARLKEQPDINVVLMDIMMPELDGYEAIRSIRLDPHLKNLPIIAMTAKAMPGDQEKCIQAGASDYISKPLDTEKLLSLMRVWLYRQA